MGFPGKNVGVGFAFSSPRDLLDPGIKVMSPTLAGSFFTTEPLGKCNLLHVKDYSGAGDTRAGGTQVTHGPRWAEHAQRRLGGV